MEGVPQAQRGAQFRCLVAICGPDIEMVVEGVVRGRIKTVLSGSQGFGYDPLFKPEGYQQTFAEMNEAAKNRISHRALAFGKAAAELRRYFQL